MDLKISVGLTRKDIHWKNKTISWDALIAQLRDTVRTKETMAEYKAMKKDQQAEIKDVGGFVGGHLKTGRRLKGNVTCRSMLTLDIDFLDMSAEDFCDRHLELLGDSLWCVYSTHKHTPESPRLRLLIPLSRDVSPEEYEAIARLVAEDIGIELFDDTTYQPSRLMYWPSTPRDGDYFCDHDGFEPMDADLVLARYTDWQDMSLWPVSSRVNKELKQSLTKQEDPTKKPGIVGAFCRTYDIPAAIDKYLADKYEDCGNGRYTYVDGSTSAGLVLYEDGLFAYSNHGTDPASGQLCNAFDLVRLHLYSAKDKGARKDTPANRLPSYMAMCDLATSDDKVKGLLAKERASAAQDFAGEDLLAYDADTTWQEALDINSKGKVLPTRDNVIIIMEHDPLLKGAIAYNEIERLEYLCRSLPWHKLKNKKIPEPLREVDWAGLRHYLEKTYEIIAVKTIEDAVHIVADRRSYHPVRDYLDGLIWDGTPRVDTLLINYLGAEDSAYVRAVTRKTLAAAVRRIFTPGCKFDYMLTLRGPQGCRKSSLARKLGMHWYSDSISSTQPGKDAYEQLNGVWIAEMGELTAMKKAESEAVKLFISKQTDRYRAAYARTVEDHPRQNIFIGTTNDREFIRDQTGGRRFWVVEVQGSKDIEESLTQDIVDQVWAEAVELSESGEKLYLPDDLELIAAQIQEDYQAQDQRLGLIQEYLEILLPEDWGERSIEARKDYVQNCLNDGDGTITALGVTKRQQVCALEIWCELFAKDKGAYTAFNSKEINGMLDHIKGWKRLAKLKKFPKPYGPQRGFIRE